MRKIVKSDGYREILGEAIGSIRARRLEEASSALQGALALDCSRPEAFNLLGIVAELGGEGPKAQNLYRASLSLDPTYLPAQANLDRNVGLGRGNSMDLGEELL